MNRLMASLTLKLLLVVGRSLASAGLFDGGDEVSGVSDSLLSKSTRIVGGVEVSIVSFITDMRNSLAHIICGGERRRIDPHQALIVHQIIPPIPNAGARRPIPLLSLYDE